MPHSARTGSVAAEQTEFARALLRDEGAAPPTLMAPGGRASQRRLAIYRNNVLASLIGCLATRFPVVARLVGEDFFGAMARVFVEHHLPRSPALIEYGGELPAFLATFEPAQSVPYLADVARIEWLIACAYHAADAPAASIGDLVSLGEDAPDARFLLHPSCALLTSRHPAFSIWQTNSRDATVRPIDVSAGGEAVLIVRPQFEVEVARIEPAVHTFGSALGSGETLESAADITTALDPAFDLARTLQTLFASGAIAGVRHERELGTHQSPTTRTMSCAS